MKQNYQFKNKRNKQLLKTNLSFFIIVIFINVVLCLLTGLNKDIFFVLCVVVTSVLFIIYNQILRSIINSNWTWIKDEYNNTNYPAIIGSFFILLFIILIFTLIFLLYINPDAFSITFLVPLFTKILTMLIPSGIFLVYIFLIIPAFILPSLKEKKHNISFIRKIVYAVLFLVILICTADLISKIQNAGEIQNKDKYKTTIMRIKYSENHLKYTDISDDTKYKLNRESANIPYLYTVDSFIFDDWESAKSFCESLNARIPNYLEIYYIVFNKFETIGDKYYWTNNFAGKYNILLHFKNMTYELIKNTGEEKSPILYCVSNIPEDSSRVKNKYLYKTPRYSVNGNTSIHGDISTNGAIQIDTPEINYDGTTEIKTGEIHSKGTVKTGGSVNVDTNTADERKYINFSIKFVNEKKFNELLEYGYYYNPDTQANPYYETSTETLNNKLQTEKDNDKNIIRMCYYPFTNYGNLTLQNEKQIWQQSFCSPAYEIINTTPVLKTNSEKEQYCASLGGRLPNIPELSSILKIYGLNSVGIKYWTNNKISVEKKYFQSSIALYYSDIRFVETAAFEQASKETAYTFCIKNTSPSSNTIANYSSRFKGENGSYYAKMICPSCRYVEMPDTILQK
ncbi:MAG: hypothetical protein LUG16_06860 [Candidatus Gastranaerophilales bacterium]|nr:hypothetical protein [Candidatus Gastranaerophilales bacterium]